MPQVGRLYKYIGTRGYEGSPGDLCLVLKVEPNLTHGDIFRVYYSCGGTVNIVSYPIGSDTWWDSWEEVA